MSIGVGARSPPPPILLITRRVVLLVLFNTMCWIKKRVIIVCREVPCVRYIMWATIASTHIPFGARAGARTSLQPFTFERNDTCVVRGGACPLGCRCYECPLRLIHVSCPVMGIQSSGMIVVSCWLQSSVGVVPIARDHTDRGNLLLANWTRCD